MAKYRVYLKDGKGIFDVEATRIDARHSSGEYNFYDDEAEDAFAASFDMESVFAILNTDKAERAFASGGVVSEENIKFPYIVNYYTKKEGETEC